MTTFGELHPDGTLRNVREIKQSDMMKCPVFMLAPEHYRDDGSCRCDDPDHKEMREWGYRFKDGKWS